MTATNTFDHVIVGGGLQGCLLAHAIAHHQPAARVLLLERSNELCGNHTWSFHGSDIPPPARSWLDPLISKTWPGYVVKFPGLSRRVGIAYETIASDDLREATIRLAAGAAGEVGRGGLEIVCGEPCEIVSPTCVQIGESTSIDCKAVLDCRGRAAAVEAPGGVGYQSFIGHEYETDRPWPVSEPTVMDVRADQARGFEFLYELPFGPQRVLLEYTANAICGADRGKADVAGWRLCGRLVPRRYRIFDAAGCPLCRPRCAGGARQHCGCAQQGCGGRSPAARL
ncbi:MAG: hypothetical protein EBZ13_12745 [Planctomycetia bacterium]|nr:hypothetical protein [Planctomycetia bacterium]